MSSESQAGPLRGLQVLELSGLSGCYTGKLFADLGATVTLIEPPGGSPLRAKPPFVSDRPGANRSLPFGYFHANKSSVVLDLTSATGAATLLGLASSSHLLILADHPDRSRVEVEALRETNESLVCVQISPFGLTGPYSSFQGDDLTLMAMGGLLSLAGHPDAAPVVAYGDQGILAADQFAACSALAALLRAELTGQGENIDVSIQESIVCALENAAQTYQLEGKVRTRSANSKRAGSGIYPVQDGEIYILAGGIGDTALWGNFARWMEAEGIESAQIFASNEWDDTSPEAKEVFERVFLPFAATRTKAELLSSAREWHVPLAPMSTESDLLCDQQLSYRGFFIESSPGYSFAKILIPGAPYKLSATPWSMQRAAPTLAAPTENL